MASENGTIGDLFMKALEPISARIPYISTAGMWEEWGEGEKGRREGEVEGSKREEGSEEMLT